MIWVRVLYFMTVWDDETLRRLFVRPDSAITRGEREVSVPPTG